jgi:hypothetical protein
MSDSYTIEEWNKLGESANAVSIQSKLNGEKRKCDGNSEEKVRTKKKQKTKEVCTESKLSRCIIM